jgi:hypothetical protein
MAMNIDVGRWHSDAVALFDKAKQLTMPLVHSGACDPSAKALKNRKASELFPDAKSAEAVLAGLLLRLNCWTEAHEVAQDIGSPEGSYWHAIVHRLEPDYGNAAYWFRRVEKHPIFPNLLARAETLAAQFPQARLAMPGEWKPEIFSRLCADATHKHGSDNERLALEIQQAEWELLMEWCA